jgi:hypothetical protein
MTVHVGHHYISNQQIDMIFFQNLQGINTVNRFKNGIPFFFQSIPKQLPQMPVVLTD